jgi:hypothetical protein
MKADSSKHSELVQTTKQVAGANESLAQPQKAENDEKVASTLGQIARIQGDGPVPNLRTFEFKGLRYFALDDKGLAKLRQNISADSEHFLQGIMRQVLDLCSHNGQIDEEQLNFVFSIIQGSRPKNQNQAMLAAQMAVVHCATMNSSRHLKNAVTPEEINILGNVISKLARTFADQMDALNRSQSEGEQKVTVRQNVSVSDNSQASIVGNVTQNVQNEVKPGARTTLSDSRNITKGIKRWRPRNV